MPIAESRLVRETILNSDIFLSGKRFTMQDVRALLPGVKRMTVARELVVMKEDGRIVQVRGANEWVRGADCQKWLRMRWRKIPCIEATT